VNPNEKEKEKDNDNENEKNNMTFQKQIKDSGSKNETY